MEMFGKKETKEEKDERQAREAERQQELKENNPDFYRLFKTEMLKSEGETEMKLYRVIKRGKKRSKEFVCEYDCEVPSETQIGEEFGGGLFWAIGWDEDGKEHMTYIRISEHFTDLKKKREQQQALMLPANQKSPMENIAEIMTVMKPILELLKGSNRNAQQDTPKIVETLIDSYSKGMQKIQGALITQKLEHIEEMNKKPKSPPPEKLNWVKEVLVFAKPFVNTFLTSNDKVQEFIKSKLLNHPDFQKIKDDDVLFKYLYTLMVQDNEIGQEKADRLFEDAGFEIPKEESTETEQGEEKEKETVAAGND